MSPHCALFHRGFRDRAGERQRLLVTGLLFLLFALGTLALASLPGLRAAHGQTLGAGRPAPVQQAGVQQAALPGGLAAGLYFRKAAPAGTEGAERPVADAPTFAAPLVHSEVSIEVHGPIERTTVRQYFLNPSDDWLEGTYVFPLPEQSAVDRLTMVVGERRIEGEIHEKQEARRIYEQARAEGRQAGLLSSERPNVFTTAVANVGPRQAVSIEIAYQQRVRYDAGRYELRFPLVVAPRYTPGGPSLVAVPMPPRPGAAPGAPKVVPIAERRGQQDGEAPTPQAERGDLFGPVVDPASGRLVPTAAISVHLDAGLPLAGIDSPSHRVTVSDLPDGSQRIDLASGPVAADRDVVLRWQPKIGAEPQAAVFAEQVGGETYLLASLLPGSAPAAALERPRDLILVVDNSGSMFGASMDQAKAAVGLALRRLKPTDRVNVIRFDDTTESLFDKARPATPEVLAEARRFVDALHADGGTEMLPALQSALGEPSEPGRLTQIVFVTDGAVSNERQLFEALSAGLGERRLFTVGIGSAPNSWFMTKAAELGRGSFTYVGSSDTVESGMAALFRKLESPAMTDVTARWTGAGAVEMVPARLPDLYVGEPVELAARLPGVPLDRLSGTLELQGARGGRSWQASLPLDRLESREGVSAIWARAKLDELDNALAEGRDESAVRAEAVPLALEHRLVTRWTSLVAVDRGPAARPAGAPLGSAPVARALPYDWSYEKVFGPAGEQADGTAEPGRARLRQALALRPAPPEELQQAGIAGSVALPQTATDAPWRALVGGLALLGGLVLLAAVRRSRPGGRPGRLWR
ncbi:Ca-activated chloride channel family protein [Tistlia consotensis]|uniref:Ca-activated chloride channel family protein n=1 Tax=Tistlia consotensis USBA 355 TaxID=560819 RepID=A0A1Y6CM93_9PROT|nr:marine proteobacterial sortase target protein [Tistlia consotensis]SMF75676.1 Ca-activated chloride channel family protein [Tistlia consotensis USBA 355]SNS07579.1 Ca-activated chloride channel family protein [Tistlia consotensis]